MVPQSDCFAEMGGVAEPCVPRRVNFYEDTLSAEDVGLDLADVARLLDLLEPLA